MTTIDLCTQETAPAGTVYTVCTAYDGIAVCYTAEERHELLDCIADYIADHDDTPDRVAEWTDTDPDDVTPGMIEEYAAYTAGDLLDRADTTGTASDFSLTVTHTARAPYRVDTFGNTHRVQYVADESTAQKIAQRAYTAGLVAFILQQVAPGRYDVVTAWPPRRGE